MKKKTLMYLLSAGMIVSLTGCSEKQKNLKVIDDYEIELGTVLSDKPEDYLTAYDDEKTRNEVIAGTILEIKGESVIEGKDYRPIGEYTATLSYKDEIEEVRVTIKDSTKPVFAEGLSDAVETYIGKKPDYASLYKAEDFDMVTVTADDSKVNYDKEGSYKVTVTATDASGNASTKEITVKVIKASLKLDKTSVSMNVQDTAVLKATIKGTDEKVTYKSSDTSVASVDSNGKITAKKKGNAVITASANGVKAECKVTVKTAPSGSTAGKKNETSAAKPQTGGSNNTSDKNNVSNSNSGNSGGSTQSVVKASLSKKTLDLINAERAKVGADALIWDSRLEEAVKIRAKEAYENYSHTRPDGTRWATVIEDLPHTAGSEIIAKRGSPQGAVDGWMNSPSHQGSMLNSNRTHAAVGVYDNCYVCIMVRY